MLGLGGAYLVLQGDMTAGAMIAGSILLGRALAPVDVLIGQWAVVQRARMGWRNLGELLAEVPVEAPPRTQLPPRPPKAHLKAENVTVVPPGKSQHSLRMVSFELKPGLAMGVIGASGAGKSSLARAITGVWRPAGGARSGWTARHWINSIRPCWASTLDTCRNGCSCSTVRLRKTSRVSP